MSESQQIPGDTQLTVTMPASLWQQVMQQLGEGKINALLRAYGEIDRQLHTQVQQLQQQPQQRSNGEARLNA